MDQEIQHWLETARHCVELGRFEEAVAAHHKALELSEKNAWEEGILSSSLALANLYCHVGRASQSEPYFQKVLQVLKGKGNEKDWIQACQSYGNTLIEQAKYGEASQILAECEEWIEQQGSPLEKAAIGLSLARVYNYLGMAKRSRGKLKQVKTLLQAAQLPFLEPYLALLEGKFEMLQGHFGKSFRLLAAAAKGFEELGDLPGKMEVLLTITASLLEHQLVQEAQGIVQQISSWDELAMFPTLEHAMYLRRLVLSAFLGQWLQSDLNAVFQSKNPIERPEDWLQFWFHLSLASQKMGEFALAKNFLQKARGVAQGILMGLSDEQRESFLRRPDIARLWRLTESASAEAQKIRGRRELKASGPADAATLAPPTPGKSPK